MLLGRQDERLALDRLLAEAREGHSGVLALVGEPGIGKTALLEHAAHCAGDMRVLRARGIQSEAEVPFAGLAELLRPALEALERIPRPQASALAGALALEPATAQDRFAVGSATLSLLSAWAEDGPVLLLVDHAQRLHPPPDAARPFPARRPPPRAVDGRGAAVRSPAPAGRPDRARARLSRGRAVVAGRRRPADPA